MKDDERDLVTAGVTLLTISLGLWLTIAAFALDPGPLTQQASLKIIGVSIAVVGLLQAGAPTALAAAGWLTAALGLGALAGPMLLVGEEATGALRAVVVIMAGAVVVAGVTGARAGTSGAPAGAARTRRER
jgi:hypothetical protein